MSFDKAKAMRNAERHVAQGKIRAAIAEYRSVIEHDPRDIATLNMLGDLYAKSSEKQDAVACYKQVAEHYNTQGFAQKAIAIYNKISRIQPESVEISAKLAELHKVKGSLAEARSHYADLAEHYQKHGRRLEALAMYKQIALLDPNNTDVCLNLADSYLREGQREDAVEAFSEAGARFGRQNRHEEAVRAYMKGFDIKSTDLRILNGLVKSQTALGRAGKAISLLEEILESEPYNRDILYMLIEACLDSQNASGAERAVIKLVELEPANYPKFLDLIRIYLNSEDPDSAARILTMSSEYMLAGGQSDECSKWINEILERDPAHLAGIRLLVRYNSWLKDENGFRLALERLYAAASAKKCVEDERFALAQLVVIRPHETRFRDRLNEINAEHGLADVEIDAELLAAQFRNEATATHTPTPEPPDVSDIQNVKIETNGYYAAAVGDFDAREFEVVEGTIVQADEVHPEPSSDLSLSDEQTLQRELESVSFYIDNDYEDLALKSLAALIERFGEQPQISEMLARITDSADLPAQTEAVADVAAVEGEMMANTLGINEIRSEFGLADAVDEPDSSDYDTHYQMAVAYQEMGLFEEALREFQEAIGLTRPDDGTRRFFYCANLLGHCFLQNGRPKNAIKWLDRSLETPDITPEEYHGVWYELAMAYEANGDQDEAVRYLEQVYAENVDFRDVSERLKTMAVIR